MEQRSVAVSGIVPSRLWIYYVAGAAGDATAACVSHPLDLIKVRYQLTGELSSKAVSKGLSSTFRQVLCNEGVVSGLYKGLSASIARQIVFSGGRHGG